MTNMRYDWVSIYVAFFKAAYIVAVGKTDAGKYEIRLKLYFIVCVCNKLSLAHSG